MTTFRSERHRAGGIAAVLGPVCRFRGLTAGTVMACAVAAPPFARAETGALSVWQEMTVLTVSKLDAAVTQCGFTLDGSHLTLLLNSAELTRAEVGSRPRSKALQAQIDAVDGAYRADREAACGRAWDTFGPDGPARGYLGR